MKSKLTSLITLLLLVIYSCEVEHQFEQEVDNPIAIDLKSKTQLKVPIYESLLQNDRGSGNWRKESTTTTNTFIQEYGSALFNDLEIIDSTNTGTVFPLVDENRVLKSWLVGFYNSNGEIEYRVRKLRDNSVERISLDVTGEMKYDLQGEVKSKKILIGNDKSGHNKTNEVECTVKFRKVCSFWDANTNDQYDEGVDSERVCKYYYLGTSCVSTFVEVQFDDGGLDGNGGWVNPFGDGNGGSSSSEEEGTLVVCTSGFFYNPETNTCEEMVDLEDAEPCIEEIVQKLMEKNSIFAPFPNLYGQSTLSGHILELFDNNSSDYGVAIVVGDTGVLEDGGQRNAYTYRDEVYESNIIIIIDDQYVANATDLSLARTIIHELVHAHLLYYYHDERNQGFRNLLNTYALDNFPPPIPSEEVVHHQFMTQYIQAIGLNLAHYDGYRLDQDYYNSLAWGGLTNTDAFEEIVKDADDRNTIVDRIIAEGTSTAEASNEAKGKRCEE